MTPRTLVLLAALLPLPAQAETAATACPMTGPTENPSAECSALRQQFRSGLEACLAERQKEALAAAQSATHAPMPAGRARFLICNAEIARSMGVAAN